MLELDNSKLQNMVIHRKIIITQKNVWNVNHSFKNSVQHVSTLNDANTHMMEIIVHV